MIELRILEIMRKKGWVWLIGAVPAAGACFLLLAGRAVPTASIRDLSGNGFQILGTVIELIKYDYVEEPNPAKTMDGAFRGLVDSLDVLSTYLNPDDAAKYRQSRMSGFQDIGVVLIKAYGGFPQVVGLIERSPAEKSGLRPGDFISSINGRSTLGFSLVETQLALKSRGGDPVKVKVLRQAATLELQVKRAALSATAPAWSRADGTAGILGIPRLSASILNAAQGILSVKLKSPGKPLILDLRNCSEGDVEQAGRLVNLFLRADPAGRFLKRQGAREPFACPQDAVWDKVPLVVWTNLGTQGPAEIAAGVLQDFGRAKVVGLPTPGLAAKVSLLPLQDGSALLLTTGVFALNSGKKIWGEGVKPDGALQVRDIGQQAYLKRTLDLLRSR